MDDMREMRVVPTINQLLKEGACVTAYDPVLPCQLQK
jgi:UDP-glucose 6-dehydrogenase